MTVDDALPAAFGFDEDSLEANRRGRLTAGQMELVEARRRRRGCGRRAAVFAVGASIVVLWVGLAASGGLSTDSVAPIVATGAVTALVAVAVGTAMALGRYRSRDLRVGRVSRAEGAVTTESVVIREQQMKVGDQYRVEIDGLRLLVGTRAQMDAFESGDPYRIFYVADPPAHHVLSAERLE